MRTRFEQCFSIRARYSRALAVLEKRNGDSPLFTRKWRYCRGMKSDRGRRHTTRCMLYSALPLIISEPTGRFLHVYRLPVILPQRMRRCSTIRLPMCWWRISSVKIGCNGCTCPLIPRSGLHGQVGYSRGGPEALRGDHGAFDAAYFRARRHAALY